MYFLGVWARPAECHVVLLFWRADISTADISKTLQLQNQNSQDEQITLQLNMYFWFLFLGGLSL